MSAYAKHLDVNFSDRLAPNKLCREIREAFEWQGWSDFVLECDPSGAAYPNTCAPIAGIIEYYSTLGADFECDWVGAEGSYIAHTRVHEPFVIGTDEGERRMRRPFDVVWTFGDSLEIRDLVDAVRTEVCEHSDVEEGVLTGIEWCLYEVMDNVLQHSSIGRGYFMGQYAEGSGRLSLCVFDNGIGILNSLKDSRHAPRDALDAVTLALQERVTRDDAIGQGNGMWGLSQVVKDNGGRFLVSSHGAQVSLMDGVVSPRRRGGFFYGEQGMGTTLVDFQLECSQAIDVAHALNHSPTLLWLENMESPDGGEYIVKVAEVSEGTGTRQAAERVRHLALNVASEGRKVVVLDFSGVSAVSSSYADELVGKLVAKVGFCQFGSRFQVRNVSSLNGQVIDRSVQQRMAQEYYGAPPIEDEA